MTLRLYDIIIITQAYILFVLVKVYKSVYIIQLLIFFIIFFFKFLPFSNKALETKK